ncbi:MAG: DegV family protein [Oscillospiraceae bacterium]
MPHEKYAVLTDSACDMPVEMAERTGVEILNFGITVDGVAYTEREDFTFDEYYDILRRCEGMPSTAHITTARFLQAFERHARQGVQQLLYVSINAGGSATHGAATMAAEKFREKCPENPMKITIVDSHCYSMAYGWFVAQAAQKLAAGEKMADVAAFLEDVFSRVEILLAAFSLKFMKKSGRINAMAAFAGELLGLRPLISLNDGVSTVQQKIRGDRDVLPAMVDFVATHRQDEGFYLVGGTDMASMAALGELCEQRFGPASGKAFKLGAAVASNTGPDAIAIVYLGPPRPRP